MIEPNAISAQGMQLSREEMYRDWLGVKCATPSYYGLLGLPERETEPTAILHAGRRIKRKLRAYQIGAYKKKALELLAEVGQAVSVLTNPEKKEAYDRDLMRQWLSTVWELYQTHCEGASREPAVLEAWLTACQARGVPFARLLPEIVRGLDERLDEWPPYGDHRLPIPVALWIYRDAVILGQCLHIGTLENRVEAVKTTQKVLGVSEGLARLAAEEVSRSLHLFASGRFVAQAKRDPHGYLTRLGRRIRRYGGHLGRRGMVLVNMAALLGFRKSALGLVFDRLAEDKESRPRRRKRSREEHRVRDELRDIGHQIAEMLHLRPQIFLTGAAILIGVLALVLAFLVARGLWVPWHMKGSSVSSSALPTPEVTAPTPTSTPTLRSVSPPPAPRPRRAPVTEEPAMTDMTGLEEFAKKYPASGPYEPPPSVAEPEVEPPPETERVERSTGGASKVPSFFSLPATPSPPKKNTSHSGAEPASTATLSSAATAPATPSTPSAGTGSAPLPPAATTPQSTAPVPAKSTGSFP